MPPHLKGWPFAAILDDQVNDLDGCDADEIAQAAYATVSTTKVIVHVKGWLRASGSGNLTAQLKKVTSGTCGCYTGSLLRARKIG